LFIILSLNAEQLSSTRWFQIKTNIICRTYNVILYRAISLTVGNRRQGYLGGAGMADYLGTSNQMKVGERTDII